jgi:SSS family solute:Na+ symporter
MQNIDWTILALYCSAMLAVGFYFARRAGKSMENYFIAGRKLPWWLLGISATATYSDAGAAPAFTMLVFRYGMIGNWWWWATFAVWMPLVAVIWSKLWRRLRIVTTAEFMQLRYGGREARIFRGIYAAFMGLGWAVLLNGYVIGWLIRAVGPIFAWSDIQILFFASGLILIYCTLSGFLGVVYSDVIQFLIFFIGNIILIPVILNKVGGLSFVYGEAVSQRGTEFFHVLPPHGELGMMTLLFLVIQGFFFASSPAGGEGYTAQRFLAAKNEFHAQTGQLFNSFMTLIVRVIPFLFLGIIGAALLPAATTDPDKVWGILVSRFSFPGLTGILVAAELAAFMSTIDTHINWGSSFLINDLYRKFLHRGAAEKHYVLISRVTTAFILILSVLVGYFLVDRMMAWFLFINSVMVAFILPLSWLRFFWWRHNIFGEAAAIIIGLPLSYFVWFPLGFSQSDKHPFWQGFLILFALGWIVIITVDLLTRPEKSERLKEFYLKCRPPGFWAPVARLIGPGMAVEQREKNIQDVIDCILGIICCLCSVAGLTALFSRQVFIFIVAGGLSLMSGSLFILRWKKRGIFRSL